MSTFRLRSEEFEELLLSQPWPADAASWGREPSRQLAVQHPQLGTGSYRSIFLPGIHIGHGCGQWYRPLLIQCEFPLDTFEMHFTLRGRTGTTTGAGPWRYLAAGEHSLLVIPGFDGRAVLEADPEQEVFEVNLSRAWLEQRLGRTHPLAEQALEQLHRRRFGALGPGARPVTGAMRRVIQAILSCPLADDTLRGLYLEGKVLELLALQLEALSTPAAAPPAAARRQLAEVLAWLAEPAEGQLITVADVAARLGCNEYAVKKLFRAATGQSVHQYVVEQRMAQAHDQLSGGTATVQEAALLAGYQNHTHFTAAFKRHFGYLPSVLKLPRPTA